MWTRRLTLPARRWVAMRRARVHAEQRGMVLTLLGHPSQSVGSPVVNLAVLIGRWSPSNLRTFQDVVDRPYGRRISSMDGVRCKRQLYERQEEHERLRLCDLEGVMRIVYLLLLFAASRSTRSLGRNRSFLGLREA
jgi:hypothetical protein